MSADENKSLILRYFSAISGTSKTESLLSEYISDSGLRRHIGAFEAAFPRYELEIEDMLAEDDKVVVRATFRGTHEGEFMGVPATGKSVTFPVIIIYQVQGGKILHHWLTADTLSLAQQIDARRQATAGVTQ
jgi:predicted ester cyclase